jgi:hypothetical protein
MVSWTEFAGQAPKMADEGRKLLYQHGVPLGYLATQRNDGGLRLHPVCPVVDEGDLWLLIGNHTPKKWDLLRSGQFALHAFPTEKDDEFMLAGTATREPDHAIEDRVRAALIATGATSQDETLFRLSIERGLLALYQPKEGGGGIWPPDYFKFPVGS